MDILEIINQSLASNPNLNEDIKNKFSELIRVLRNKLPDVDLTRLNEKLKTVMIGKLGKFERKGTYFYDVFKNEVKFSNDLEKDYDIDNLFMKAILEMATSTNSFTGFNSDERLRALNLAYTEILATFIIGNEGDSELEEEMLITNLISHIIGKETLYNSYFTNNGVPIIKALQEVEVGML